ncbi:hypothetical protein [Micromonospora sp. NPDC003776]
MHAVVTDIESTPAAMTAAFVAATTTGGSLIDEIVPDAARRMLDAQGRRPVVRNGRAAGARFERGRLVERPNAAAA